MHGVRFPLRYHPGAIQGEAVCSCGPVAHPVTCPPPAPPPQRQ